MTTTARRPAPGRTSAPGGRRGFADIAGRDRASGTAGADRRSAFEPAPRTSAPTTATSGRPGSRSANDTVCGERTSVQSLVRTAHGTEESPGSRVAAKRGLSRELANAAPGEQRLALKAAVERHWATFVETPARTSSTFCPVCRHRTGNNRKMASGVPVRQVRARRQHRRERGKEPTRPGRVGGPPGRDQGGAWGNPPKRPAGKQNRGSASKASGSNTPAHRRNPTRRPGLPPRTGSPSVSTTGTGARAMEAATRSENTASRPLR